MKRKVIDIILIIICFILFIYSSIVMTSLKESLIFIYKVIIPSLFPFMIFINFILYSDCINLLANIFKPLKKVFRLSKIGVVCIIAAILGGYPYSAILITSLLKDKKIDENEAERIIKYSFFPSLSFLFMGLYSIDKKAIYIIISLYLSSFILLFISSFKQKSEIVDYEIESKKFSIDIFYKVMNLSFSSIFTIAFCIIFFNFFKSLLSTFIFNDKLIYLLSGLLEFSKSSIEILSIKDKSIIDYFILNAIISFSSLSIIFQAMYYLKDVNFKLKKILIARLYVLIISSIIFLIIFK